jgi:carbamoyltransferase
MIPYQGPEYSQKEIEKALKEKEYDYEIYDDIEKVIAKLISEGKIVANFQGRLELGPRALGNRSLLASPEKYESLVRMNTLKGREVWRPLAPAVMYDKQTTCFDSDIFSPHMTKNFNVLNEMKNRLEAITHVDGTARIQSVTKEYNELFYKIIDEFYQITKIPVLINTSFNVKGEPIVCTPEEAIDSFERMNLDYMSIGKCLIKRKQ